jgi:hypothetical protein
LLNQFWIEDSCGIEAHFVSSGVEHISDILNITQATSNSEWHEALGGSAFNDINHSVALVAGCRDIQKYKFISTLLLVCLGLLDWVPRID